jgi:hypothetical protein
MIAQNAGASTSVASRIARHFFWGDSGATPAGGDGRRLVIVTLSLSPSRP